MSCREVTVALVGLMFLVAVPSLHAEKPTTAKGIQTSLPPGLETVDSALRSGSYAQAESLARVVLEQVKTSSGDRSLQVAQVLDRLVESFWRSGKATQPEARELAEQAVAIKEKHVGGEDPELATSLANQGNVLFALADYTAARPPFERALAIRRKVYGPNDPRVADSMADLALLLEATGEYETARPLLVTALEVRERIDPEDIDVSRTLNMLATVLKDEGDYAGAASAYDRALEIRIKLRGEKHLEVAGLYNNKAALCIAAGDYVEAKSLLERARDIRVTQLGPKHLRVGSTVNNLALVNSKMGDYETAKQLYVQARQIFEDKLGPDHPTVAACLHGYGNLLIEMGDYTEACRAFERTLQIRTKRLPEGHPDIGWSLNALATAYADTDELNKAIEYNQRAIAILEKAEGVDHPDVADCVKLQAVLWARTGDSASALEAALRAETIGRNHLRLIAQASAERQALRYETVRASGLDLALSLVLTPDVEAGSRPRVWDALVRSRALILDEMAARHRNVVASTDARTAQLANELNTARRLLSNLVVRGPAGGSPESYRALLDEARRKKEKVEQALAERNSQFRHELEKSRIGGAEVTRQLLPHEALVAYVLYDRYDFSSKTTQARESSTRVASSAASRIPIPSYMAFVLRGGEANPIALELGGAREVDDLVRRWLAEASRGTMERGRSPEQAEEAYRRAGAALRAQCWDPFAQMLHSVETVFVVPDGALNLVNWSTLPETDGQGYLIESGPLIHYLSTERDLMARAARPHWGRGLLAMGGPDYDGTSGPANVSQTSPRSGNKPPTSTRSFRGALSSCSAFQSIRFKQLPATIREVQDVGSIWERSRTRRHETSVSRGEAPNPETACLIGSKASESAFKELAPGRRVVHLATHGFFVNPSSCASILGGTRGIGETMARPATRLPEAGENPLVLSGLAWTGANARESVSPDGEDGILTAEEVASLDLHGVEWMVLSACDTGVGEVRAGEGVFGLRRAFQVAGAATVIMSLWPVQDEPAREWMLALYEGRFLEHLSTIEAVHKASLRSLMGRRQRQQSTHPYYWAGFVATGRWE